MSSELIFITAEEEGERLDKVLAKRFLDIKSRNYFQTLIDKERILLNGVIPKKRVKLTKNDEVEIHFILTPEIGLKPENIPLNIVFEDEDIIVINKPAGMVVHPAPGHWTGTFVNALLYHCQGLETCKPVDTRENYPRPGIVHRLDKETTGLLVAAKNALAHERLVQMFAAREVHKEYLALCIGNPGDREIKSHIGRHPINRKLMTVLETGGKEAITLCKTISHSERFSLVNVTILTGRTHQIRVHLKSVNTPILGCPLYGNPQINQKYQVTRQMLHAAHLNFKHPIKATQLEFTLPLPADMKSLIHLA